jgi:hypothetical protein
MATAPVLPQRPDLPERSAPERSIAALPAEQPPRESEPVQPQVQAVEPDVPGQVEPARTAALPPPPGEASAQPTRIVGKLKPAPGPAPAAPEPSLVPVSAAPAPEKPVVEMPPAEAAPKVMMSQMPPVMPGSPVVNNTGASVQPEPVVPGLEPPPARMAGMAMEMEQAPEQDEGLLELQRFLEERNKTVPQPPAQPARTDRRPRKSL